MFNPRDYARLRFGVLAVTLTAWVILLAQRDAPDMCAPGIGGTSLWGVDVPAMAKAWTLMLVAMMSPMLVAPLYFVFMSSLARNRLRLMALCAVGYGAAWTSAGIVISAATLAAKAWYPGSWGPALAVGLAACVWQASPWKKVCLNRCHRHRPLPAFGVAAYRDALRVGLEHGGWCVGSCWLNMMWPMLLPDGHTVGMLAAALLMYCERLDPAAAPAWRLRGFRTAAWCLVCLCRRMWKRLQPAERSLPV